MAMYPTHLADTPEQARATAEPAWAYWLGLLAPELAAPAANRGGVVGQVTTLRSYDYVVAERHMPFGTADAALATVRWLERCGVTHLGLTFHFGGLDHAAALRAIDRWGREVAPAVR
jgi:hypothetical protein